MSTDTGFDYATLLPELLQRAPDGQASGAAPVARLLQIIDPMFAGFETLLDALPDFFDPLQAREDFLPWLASWSALVLRADWSLQQKRNVLFRIIPLYRQRGTKAGLEEYLKIYAGEGVSIVDDEEPPQGGEPAGSGPMAEGDPAHHFRVNVAFSIPDRDEVTKKTASVKAVLDIEKPAHTHYTLTISGPTLQIGRQSTVGRDTFI
jgi:phage tail-like protein